MSIGTENKMKLNGKTIGFNIFITTIIILASYELSGVVIIPLILSKQFFYDNINTLVISKNGLKLEISQLSHVVTETLELPGVFVPYPEEGREAKDQRLPSHLTKPQ